MMLRDVPLRFVLVAGFLVSGLVPLCAASLLSLSRARDEQRVQVFHHLESVRDIKAAQLGRFFEDRVRLVESIASSPGVGAAVRDFEGLAAAAGFAPLGLAATEAGAFVASDAYRTVHDRHTGWFADLIARNRFYDLFLMDLTDGYVYYSVRKEPDFGVPAARVDSPLREVWEAAREGAVALSDTRLYAPSRGVPAQFLAVPVRDGDRIAAVLAVQISIDSIDAIMAERSGMGKSGETYVVGPDLRMRSDASLDPAGHGVVASFEGSIAANGADTEPVRAAFEGRSDFLRTRNYRGVPVLSAFGPVRFRGVTWAMVADVGEAEIEERISDSLDTPIGVILALAVVLVVVLALAVSFVVGRGIRHVRDETARLVDQVLAGRLDARGDPDNAPVDFRPQVERTNQLVAALEAHSEARRRLEGAVETDRRMQALGTLAGGIAHDFNNILSYLYNYTTLVERALPPDSPAREHIAGIETGIERASELVSQILVFGRQGRRETTPVRVSIAVKEAVKLVQAALPPGVDVSRDLSDEPLWVSAEPAELLQVVTNLATNAWQAMKATGGRLRVTLRRARAGEAANFGVAGEGDACVLEVEDTGPGMDEATRERAFEPFFTTKPVGEGTGMGLAVVHGIVRRLKGEIRLASRPGEGTTAIVCLPLCPPPERPDATSACVEAVPAGVRVLFVDDEAAICDSARGVLEDLGCRVWAATSPAAALERFQADPTGFDVVLTDLAMPGMDGIALAARIRAVAASVPIVLVTGYADRVDEAAVAEAGYAAVVSKPWKRPEMARVLCDVLGGDRDGRFASRRVLEAPRS